MTPAALDKLDWAGVQEHLGDAYAQTSCVDVEEALNWLAVNANMPEIGFHGIGIGWIACARFDTHGSRTVTFRSPSPWLVLIKLVAAVQLHKRGELEL